VQRALREVADAVVLGDVVTPHTLRHGSATHLLEQGVGSLPSRTSTTRYARVAINTIREMQSPLELLCMEKTD
jgi:integrase